jgi:cellulose synthase/poly-beta-1,6-N-acetylglucosamine synthase-like glycosyltransferase
MERIKRKIPEFSEKNAPFVSLIIPAYNEEKSIAETIKSILAIDYPKNKFEIIVVDDGSKDNSYKIAKTFESSKVKVFSKKNGGKGSALNYGLKHAKGEIIFTMDADSVVMPDSVKYQVAKFYTDSRVMCVSPVVAVYKPKGIFQRVQQIEYMLGVFIREAFASYNAIHITPGAFSAYRKIFFDKHGGFDEKNITEDLEMSLRVQYKGYMIENADKSVVYTHAPKTFKSLMIQRRRWYFGLIDNLIHYSGLISRNYGALGIIVLPVAIVAIFFAIFLTFYAVVKLVLETKKQLILLSSINFDYTHTLSFSWSYISDYLFKLVTSPITLSLFMFILLSLGYLFYAKTKIKKHSNLIIGLPLFFAFYALLFAFWWTIAFIYSIFNKKVSWR